MSDQYISIELNFIRFDNFPLPDYRIEPNLHLKHGRILKANAYYEIFKFIEEFLKLNYIHYNPCETWQRKDSITGVIGGFLTDYRWMLKKLGWDLKYTVGEPKN